MKIVYCLNSISEIGGIENITIAKANALSEIESYEVFVVVTDYKDCWPATKLSQKVVLIDLGINYYKNDWKSSFHAWRDIFIKRLLHKKKLKKILNQINPDIVISVGQAEKYMLTSIKGNWKLIREFHYVKNYRTVSLTKQQPFKRIIAHLCDFYDFKFRIKKYDRIISLTEEDYNDNWKKDPKVSVIHNFISNASTDISNLENKKIISVGRLEYPKNFSLLILAFKIISMKHPDWILEIYGSGSEKEMLTRLINNLNLSSNVSLKGSSENIGNELREASIFAMTSRFEGFPLALVEALSYGLPVVTFDCKCGPKDIIKNNKEGFLVNSENYLELAEKLLSLIENPLLRKEMGHNAWLRSFNFQRDIIINKWIKLFQDISEE